MPAATRACAGRRVSVPAGEDDPAGEALRHADQGVEQRRLAGAVAPEQGQRLALVEREAETLDDDGLAVAGAQVLDPEQLSHDAPSPR